MEELCELLSQQVYPGRGIALGRSEDDRYGIIVYFIMGRSENSRNRVFLPTLDGIRTEAYDPAKMTDPSLIIYHPVRRVNLGGETLTVVTNGDQTDTVRDGLLAGKTFEESLATRTFEPDEPNYTPRISGLLHGDGSYRLSILKSLDGDPSCCLRQFFQVDHPQPGTGHFIHTYQQNGNPLPSFQGEPRRVRLSGDLEQLAHQVWYNLNQDNRVSLFTAFVDLQTGEITSHIINRHG